MASRISEVVVFPTDLAARRYQREVALKTGGCIASGHTTFAHLRRLCLSYAKVKGEVMDATQQLLMRKQVVEVAAGYFSGAGALGDLSLKALSGVLAQLLTELATLPTENARIVEWMLSHHPSHKLYQLGTLASVWRAIIKQEGYADAIDINIAVFRLLKGPRENWPPQLRDTKRITFKSVRWLNPFEESCIAALNQKLKVRIESALPPAYAEESANRLGAQIRSEIMSNPWAVWAEDLSDALAVNSADLFLLDSAERIHFSRSAGAYGEVEDLARRIAWALEHQHLDADQIALIVPNIGTVQDIVPNVFSRFKIPYYFRRGRPVLSSPVVKAFLAWIAFPLRPERDLMVDLLRNPSIVCENREKEIERLLKKPPILQSKSIPISAADALHLLAEKIVPPEDDFNREALKSVSGILGTLGTRRMPPDELLELVEELLKHETVSPRESHEQGVWILNPLDAVGLEFDLVLFAGLNEGEFPGTPRQDALLNDLEREQLSQHLNEQLRRLPKMALPQANVLFEQESVLFLTTLGMARKQIVFSYQSVDQEGNERSASEYYRKLWNISGWPAQETIELSLYDQWRQASVGNDSIFENHWNSQQNNAPEDREPMPGESFLPIIPMALCRAEDEALQSAVMGADVEGEPASTEASGRLKHLVAMLEMEHQRERFLETPIDERGASPFCGHLTGFNAFFEEWLMERGELSPTALEDLAHCRYLFFLNRMVGLKESRQADDSPDPMERGGLIHSILREIYSGVADGLSGIPVPPQWAVKTDRGWIKRTQGGIDALALAVFAPEYSAYYLAFAEQIIDRRLNEFDLGHPGVWAAERCKIREIICNFIQHDVATCQDENRFPALFELSFGGESAVDLGELRVHGIIDRVDLIFSETNELSTIRVLDYKGVSRARKDAAVYIDEMVYNINCQLPIYAFAAQLYFYGAYNQEAINQSTEVGYLFYEREFSKVARIQKKSVISMGEDGLIDGFLATLHANIARLKNGDFAVDPLIESYGDYSSICRVDAVALADLQEE